jgi:ATP-binding cassette subfamily F protein 2
MSTKSDRPLSAKERRALKKAQEAQALAESRSASEAAEDAAEGAAEGAPAEEGEEGASVETSSAKALSEVEQEVLSNPRAATGVLFSDSRSHDIHIGSFSLRYHGVELIQDSDLHLNYGRRYAVIGSNGSGKSTMLKCIALREVPIPESIDIYFLNSEVSASSEAAIDVVVGDVVGEVKKLEAQAEELQANAEDPADIADDIALLYERIEILDADTAVARAAAILHGLGFDAKMQKKAARDFSGGWRMRIALARALFIKPMLLVLDEPTNHLDITACVWLEEYLRDYPHILLMVSHSQDFMNVVATNILLLSKKKLTTYSGNYDTYVQTRAELETDQMTRYKKEQDQIADMKDYIARFGHGSAKLARQAQSKQKVLDKMVAGGLTEEVRADRTLQFKFPSCGELAPPVMQFNQVDFGYSPSAPQAIYKNLDFGVDLDSRIALVGPNGVGKSTLLKLMCQELVPTSGTVRCHSHLRIGRYSQHSADQLEMHLTPCEYMVKMFPDKLNNDNVRSAIGRFGITGNVQTMPIRQMSDGQKSRLVFAYLAHRNPHMLLLDEPTNHLDIETIDSLAAAINEFDGGLVLVSHDFRLISQVCQEIWVCDKRNVHKWSGDIQSYKAALKSALKHGE